MYKCTFIEFLPFMLKGSKHVVVKVVSMKKSLMKKRKMDDIKQNGIG